MTIEEITEMRKHKNTGELVYQIDGETWYALDQVYREEISEEVAQEPICELLFRTEEEAE